MLPQTGCNKKNIEKRQNAAPDKVFLSLLGRKLTKTKKVCNGNE